MMWKLVLIWAIFCGCGCLGHVRLSIYYETLSPDSASFLVNQFYPVYLGHGDHMITKLIPFGKSNATKESDGSWRFECNHGQAECYGNKIHSCALELFTEEQSFEFIFCSMNSGDATLDANLEVCAKSSNVSWTSLQDCITSGKGDEYLAANGEITSQFIPNVTNALPTVVFSGVYNKELQNLAVIHFMDLVVFINDQVHCGFCQFLSHSSGSNLSFSSEKFISIVALLTLIIQKLFA